MTSFVNLLLFLALATSALTLEVIIPLQKVDLFERLGLNDESTAQGAFEDGRLDAILAMGGDMYTAQLGVGTPQQPLDFVLNFVGGQISPGIGDLPLVIGKNDVKNETKKNERMFNGENEATLAFNSSASSTFNPRPDIHFHTVINPYPWSFNAVGSIAEENIQLPYSTTEYTEEDKKIILRERMLGHVEHIGSEVFGKLQIGGILRSWFGHSPYMAYEDKEERIAVVNPNSMFLQGPQKTVQIWAKMANAVQMTIGRQQLYVINCDEQFGPLTFKIGKWNDYSLAKDLLQIELPSNLLPKNKCLWAIQEGTEKQDFWIIGRPFFKQYCLVLDLPHGRIDFPEI